MNKCRWTGSRSWAVVTHRTSDGTGFRVSALLERSQVSLYLSFCTSRLSHRRSNRSAGGTICYLQPGERGRKGVFISRRGERKKKPIGTGPAFACACVNAPYMFIYLFINASIICKIKWWRCLVWPWASFSYGLKCSSEREQDQRHKAALDLILYSSMYIWCK